MKFLKIFFILQNIFYLNISNTLTNAGVIPDDVIKCHFADVSCLMESAEKLLKTYSKTGIPGFDADMKDLIEVKFSIPKVEIKGHYSVNGNVLILPIVGKGKSKIVLEDVLVKGKLQPEAYIKEGHTYMKVASSRFDVTPNHAAYNLEGLFNGDKVLGDNMNKFLNENWSDIFNELKPDLSVALSEIAMHIMNEPFSKLPYESLFLK